MSTAYSVTFDGTPNHTIDFGFALTRNPWFNVIDYGALGDGVHDDTSSINSAITAASGGGVVFFPPGSYKLSGSGIAMNQSKVTLRGSGQKASSLQAPIGTTNAIVVSAASCVIEELGVDGRYSLQTNNGGQSSQVGIYLAAGADFLTVRRCFVHDTCGHGISSLNGGADLKVEECLITNQATAAAAVQMAPVPTRIVFAISPGTAGNFQAGQAIRVGSQNGSIQSVQALRSAVASVASSSVFTVLASNGGLFSPGQIVHVGSQPGTVQSISGDTITLASGLTTAPTPGQIVAVDNLTLSAPLTTIPLVGSVVAVAGGYLKGVFVTGAPRPVIRHSFFSGWSQAIGLWFGVTDALVEGNSLINNYGYEDVAHTVNRSALELYPANNPGGTTRVIGNVIDGSTHNCIECAQGEVGTVFQANTLRNWASESGLGNTGVGLEITGQSTVPGHTTEIAVLGNTLNSNGAFGSTGVQVNDYTSRVKIEGNQFYTFNATSAAYAIFIGSGDGPVILGNSFNSCAVGIWVNSSGVNGGIISGNSFWNLPTAFGANAIVLAAAGDGWLIEQNCIDSDPQSGARGIQLLSGNQHRLIGNRIRATNPLAISMNDGLVECNIILKNINDGAGGIRVLNSSARNVIRNNVVTNTPGYTISIEGSADFNQITGNQFPTSISTNGDVRITTTAVHNTVASNSQNGIFVAEAFKLLASQIVGAAQVSVPHGLGYTPAHVVVSMTSPGTIYRSAVSDSVNVYLTADAAGRTTDIYVR